MTECQPSLQALVASLHKGARIAVDVCPPESALFAHLVAACIALEDALSETESSGCAGDSTRRAAEARSRFRVVG